MEIKKEDIIRIKEDTKNNIKEVETFAEDKGVYCRIDETNEIKKRFFKKYPFLNLEIYKNWSFSDFINEDILKEDIERAYLRRYDLFLRGINFIDIDSKKKTIKLKREYSHSLNLWFFNWLEEFKNYNLNKEDINILKEYKNGNVEFSFKDKNLFNIFYKVVYWSNKQTEFILNNITEEEIKTFKEANKKPFENELYTLYQVLRRGDFKFKVYNSYLIKEKLI